METVPSDWLFPRAASVDSAWLCRWFGFDQSMIQQLRSLRFGQRHLDRYIRAYCGTPTQPDSDASRALCMLSNSARQALAGELGWRACRPLVTRVVAGRLVARLRQQMGSARYHASLAANESDRELLPNVQSIQADFERACVEQGLAIWVSSVGIALLESLLRPEASFATRRLRLCVAPGVWERRPRDLQPAAKVLEHLVLTTGATS